MQQGQSPNENRNLILAIVLSVAVLIGFEVFVFGPNQERAQAERAAAEELAQQEQAAIEAGQAPAAAPGEAALRPRDVVLAATASARVAIATSALTGTIALEGARFDDLNLTRYRRTLDDPETVTLLAPRDSEDGFDVVLGWEDADQAFPGVGDDAVWQVAQQGRLTPESPLVLTHTTADGLELSRRISVDDNYLFTVEDTVVNASGVPRSVRPYGVVRRQDMPADFRNNAIVHQGFTGVFGPQPRLHEVRYQKAQEHARNRERGRVGEDERIEELSGPGGWLGVTDHYWLAALIPAQTETINAFYDARRHSEERTSFRAAYRGEFRALQPGETVTYTQHVYAGAKRVEVLQAYQEALGAPDLDKAVDWGNFWFLTRPFFSLLEWFYGYVGNFGVAILLATIVIKLVLFPLVYQSYKAMAKMRQVAPKMKEIQERFAADKQRQMQEMQRLYRTEKVNPVAGCLPILLQIPVFFALYKTLTVTIEMRHAPFFGWVRDLSAPDSAYITNLFGLIPYDPAGVPVLSMILAVGIWPILYGVSMFALQGLSPPPPDKIQQQIFKMLPIVFTFIFAGFAAGMVIYWTWSNTLSILQQYVIMRRQGVETEFDKFIAKRFGKGAARPAE